MALFLVKPLNGRQGFKDEFNTVPENIKNQKQSNRLEIISTFMAP